MGVLSGAHWVRLYSNKAAPKLHSLGAGGLEIIHPLLRQQPATKSFSEPLIRCASEPTIATGLHQSGPPNQFYPQAPNSGEFLIQRVVTILKTSTMAGNSGNYLPGGMCEGF